MCNKTELTHGHKLWAGKDLEDCRDILQHNAPEFGVLSSLCGITTYKTKILIIAAAETSCLTISSYFTDVTFVSMG